MQYMHTKVTSYSNNSRPTCAVVGARGYTGLETIRLLLSHPEVSLTHCYATSAFEISSLFPYKDEKEFLNIQCLPQSEILNHKVDIVFLATPAEASLELAPKLIAQGSQVIDLSGAFRLKSGITNKDIYPKWYKFSHSETESLEKAEFGLLPWAGAKKNNGINLISNPGCYATSIMMALIPLLKEEVIDEKSIVIDAKSGTTGAGKKAAENLLYSEVDGECLPYRIGQHQHFPEIQEYVKQYSGKNIDPHFSTSLLATRRGIISSLFLTLNENKTEQDVQAAFSKHYANYPFVKVSSFKKGSELASLKKVVGTNNVHLSYVADGNKLYVFSVIDNLVKGAAGQAVENMNRLLDYPIDMGLNRMEVLI